MCFIDLSELKFQVLLDSIKSKLIYKLSNMDLGWGLVGLGLGWVGLGCRSKIILLQS